MELYITKSSFGTYEDFYELENGIFSSIDDAEKLKSEIEEKVAFILKTFPAKITECEKSLNPDDKYEFYYDTLEQAKEYNNSYIDKIELDKKKESWLDGVGSRLEKLERILDDEE